MAEVSATVAVAVPAECSWAGLVDWAAQGEWVPFTRVRVPVGYGAADGAGGRLEAFTGIGRLGFWDSMEITCWEPPRRCEVRHTGGVVRGAGAFEVRPEGEAGSTVTWTEWFELPLAALGAVFWLAGRPVAELSLRRVLARFARWAATGRPLSYPG